MRARRTRRLVLGVLLAPTLLLSACATGTTPGADGDGDGSDGGTVTTPDDPDSPTSSGDDSGGSGSDASTDPATPADPVAADLTVSLDETGSGTFTTWTLTCAPDGGDHPDPAGACAALAAAGGTDAFIPVPRDAMCTEIYGGPQVARVDGTVGGVAVSGEFSRSNGCHIAKWDALAPLLGTPGGVTQ